MNRCIASASIALLAAFAAPIVRACPTTLPLKGVLTVDACFPRSGGDCVDAAKTLHDYLEAQPDDPAVVTVAVQSSPWRFYGPDMRIFDIDEFTAPIRSFIKPGVNRVELQGSWTGVSPDKHHKSLADQVAAALGHHVPVAGMSGFLWVSKDGSVRATNHAFTLRKGIGQYGVHRGSDVMAALTAGWIIFLESNIEKEGDADGMMRVAAAYDIFMLCPERALSTFEHAAKMGSAIASYDAAMIRLDRGETGDRQAAMALFERAAALGDDKARERLRTFKQ